MPPRRSFARRDETHIYTVSELTFGVKAAVEQSIPPLWMIGEVSNVKYSQSGHIYLVLKDRNAQVNAVLWRTNANRLRFKLDNGQEVLVFGRVEVYAPHGRYQIIVEQVQPRGVGDLQVAFEQLKAKLGEAGLFEPSEKMSIPWLPSRIGVITSPTGAAFRDILSVLKRRFPAVEVVLNPVPVQGHGAAQQIARAIEQMNAMGECDVLIVGRGGGSMEDLWAFNEEVVAWAIHHSDIPIISAVGHETDFTIADLVADERAPTPTAAAELAVPDRMEVLQRLNDFRRSIRRGLQSGVNEARLRLRTCAESYALRQPVELVRQKQQRLDELSERLSHRMGERLAHGREGLHQLAAVLDSLSPLKVLQRGYSVTRRDDGTVVRSAEGLKADDKIQTVLSHGRVYSRVESIEESTNET